MQDENLYPNDGGTYYKPELPEDRKDEESEEKAKALAGMPMITDLIAHFEARIAFYDSLESIPSDVSTQPEEHLRTVLANQMTKENLVSEKEYLEGLQATYKQG
jgi:hypothetical protein